MAIKKKTWWYLKDKESSEETLTCHQEEKEKVEQRGHQLQAEFQASSLETAGIIKDVIAGWLPDAESLLQELAEYWDYELKKKPH